MKTQNLNTKNVEAGEAETGLTKNEIKLNTKEKGITMKKSELIKKLNEAGIKFTNMGYCLKRIFEVCEYLDTLLKGYAIDGIVVSEEEYNDSEYGVECYTEYGKYAFEKKENDYITSKIYFNDDQDSINYEEITGASYSIDWGNCAGDSIEDDVEGVIDFWLEK